jgi:hypothetical protein
MAVEALANLRCLLKETPKASQARAFRAKFRAQTRIEKKLQRKNAKMTVSPITMCMSGDLLAGPDLSGHGDMETINKHKKRPSCCKVIFSRKKGKKTIVRKKSPVAFSRF